MKWTTESVKEKRITDMILAVHGERQELRMVLLLPDCLLLLLEDSENSGEVREYFQNIQDEIESRFDILTFISISPVFRNYRKLPDSYREAMKLQKYLLVDGYGVCVCELCVDEEHIQDRKSEDIVIDRELLQKMILKKENEGVFGYIEDLFINNLKRGVSVESLYQMAVHIAMFLQEIKKEYKFRKYGKLHDLPDLLDTIYQADDIFGIKALFISEANGIIQCLHEENYSILRWYDRLWKRWIKIIRKI